MTKGTSFKKVVLCHTNDFEPGINEKIQDWVEANGATFVKKITPEVTHLVASKKAWKRYYPLVKQARRTRKIRIVCYDWLEDSLHSKPIRALPEEKYLYEQTKLRIRKRKKINESLEENPIHSEKQIIIPRDKRIELAAEFHPYSDKTGFVYIVTLLRYDILRRCFEKYKLKVGHNLPSVQHEILPSILPTFYSFPKPEPFSTSSVTALKSHCLHRQKPRVHIAEPWAQCLQLYESDRAPHTYACYIQYTRRGVRSQIASLAPPGSTWSFAWNMFTKFFSQKIGITWEARAKNGIEIHVNENTEMEYYRYLAPKDGEPEGLREVADSGAAVSCLARMSTTSNTDRSLGNPDGEIVLGLDGDDHYEDGHHP